MAAVDEFLGTFSIFEGLSPEALDYLGGAASTREVAAGEVVFQEGDFGDDLYLLESGTVQVIRGFGTDKERRLAELRAPDFFGEMSILECQPRSASILAVDPARVHVLLSTSLYGLFTRMPDQYALLIHRLARLMAGRLRAEGMEFRR